PAGAKVDLALGVALESEERLALLVLDEPSFGEERVDSSAAGIRRGLRPRERQLRARADKMRAGDGGIGGIDDRRLERAREELIGVRHEVLIERVGLRDEDDERFAVLPPHTADPLPGRHDAAGVADEDADIEPADVDAELEGARRHDADEIAA